jgi:hypothetical protein
MLEATSSYGPIKKKQDYRVIKQENDWCLAVVKGKPVYVPKWVFENDSQKRSD